MTHPEFEGTASLMPAPPQEIHPYRLTTLRPMRGEETEVRLVGEPRVGHPMIMFGRDGLRIITTRVLRLMRDAATAVTYVQTKNTLYLLSAS